MCFSGCNAGKQQERKVRRHRIYIQKLQSNQCQVKKKRFKNGYEGIEKKIKEENIPELKKDMSIQTEMVHQMTSRTYE